MHTPGPTPGLLRHPSLRRRGHTAGSVLCLAPAPHPDPLFVSGGEDGAVCLHDLRCRPTDPPAARLGVGDAGAGGVAALAWDGPTILHAAAGPAVLRLDTRLAGGGGGGGGGLASLGPAVTTLLTAADDVGGLACPAPGLLVAADDAGCVNAIQASASPSSRPPRVTPLPLLHTNLAACLVGRPSRPEEAISGGFDCVIARWDVAGRRCLAKWEAGACVAAAQGGGGGGSSRGTPSEVLNPPFVHALAAGVTCAVVRPLTGLVAAALGDGSVLLLDVAGGGGAPSTSTPRPGARAVRARPASAAPPPPPGVLAALSAHTRAATAVAFSPAPTLPWLVSGGDDGRVVVWDWRAGMVGRARGAWAGEVGEVGEGGRQRPAVLGEVGRGRKVQAVGVCGESGSGQVVCVGDTGRGVGVWEVGEG